MWKSIKDELPPEDLFVDTKIDDEEGVRNNQPLKLVNGQWFLSDGVYVYYKPTHWKPKKICNLFCYFV